LCKVIHYFVFAKGHSVQVVRPLYLQLLSLNFDCEAFQFMAFCSIASFYAQYSQYWLSSCQAAWYSLEAFFVLFLTRHSIAGFQSQSQSHSQGGYQISTTVIPIESSYDFVAIAL